MAFSGLFSSIASPWLRLCVSLNGGSDLCLVLGMQISSASRGRPKPHCSTGQFGTLFGVVGKKNGADVVSPPSSSGSVPPLRSSLFRTLATERLRNITGAHFRVFREHKRPRETKGERERSLRILREYRTLRAPTKLPSFRFFCPYDRFRANGEKTKNNFFDSRTLLDFCCPCAPTFVPYGSHRRWKFLEQRR